MKYTIQNNKSLKEFGEMDIGELFIVNDIPFIKVPEIRDDCHYEIIYNCVRLDNGTMWHCPDDRQVKQPKNGELKIEM